MSDLKSRYEIGWLSTYDTLKGMVALYGAAQVTEALAEITGGLTPRVQDASKVCRVLIHFYVDGVCSQCGSKEPPRQ